MEATTKMMVDPTNYYPHYFEYIAQLSMYKLQHPEQQRAEPLLRRQVLIRNVLLSTLPPQELVDQSRQEEEWLDACFDQLDDDMDDDDDDELALNHHDHHPNNPLPASVTTPPPPAPQPLPPSASPSPPPPPSLTPDPQHWLLALPVNYHHPSDPPPPIPEVKLQDQITLIEWSW